MIPAENDTHRSAFPSPWSVTAQAPLGHCPVQTITAPFVPGQVCWFSGAGPTVTGVPKPEISAPGAYVVAAMSSEAPPGAVNSIFTDEACPANDAGVVDPRCLQVDPTHGVAQGTSMSAPMVTGAIALLFERNPTLTETQIVPILQGGAHYFRAPAYDLATDVLVPFEDEGGPGELDILGSFQVMDQMSDPVLTLPSPCASATSCKSWITLSTDYVLADGSTPTVAIVELRTAGGTLPDLFEPSRLRPAVTVDGLTLDTPPTLVRRGPGVWFYSLTPPAGFGGQSITFGANFDGVPIVIPRTLSVATDPWTATSPSQATGSGCTAAPSHARPPGARGEAWAWGGCLGVLVVLSRRRTRRITASRMPR